MNPQGTSTSIIGSLEGRLGKVISWRAEPICVDEALSAAKPAGVSGNPTLQP
jgi:hypothetical protein